MRRILSPCYIGFSLLNGLNPLFYSIFEVILLDYLINLVQVVELIDLELVVALPINLVLVVALQGVGLA